MAVIVVAVAAVVVAVVQGLGFCMVRGILAALIYLHYSMPYCGHLLATFLHQDLCNRLLKKQLDLKDEIREEEAPSA